MEDLREVGRPFSLKRIRPTDFKSWMSIPQLLRAGQWRSSDLQLYLELRRQEVQAVASVLIEASEEHTCLTSRTSYRRLAGTRNPKVTGPWPSAEGLLLLPLGLAAVGAFWVSSGENSGRKVPAEIESFGDEI